MKIMYLYDIKNYKMKKITKKEKMRDLLCCAINLLIENNVIDLDVPSKNKEGYLQTEIHGYRSVITWSGISHDELRVSIWWGCAENIPLSACAKPLVINLKNTVKVCCSGWIERKAGKWLQGYGDENIFDVYCANSSVNDLMNIPIPITLGYNREGRYYF